MDENSKSSDIENITNSTREDIICCALYRINSFFKCFLLLVDIMNVSKYWNGIIGQNNGFCWLLFILLS